MQIDIIAVGKIKEEYLRQGIAEYAKRLGPYVKLKQIEVPDVAVLQDASLATIDQSVAKEGQAILAQLKPQSYNIALAIEGKTMTSPELADYLDALALKGESHLTFIIGGSHGLDTKVLRASQMQLSFGSFTYPHQLMRLILLEQLYRACKIRQKEPYHK